MAGGATPGPPIFLVSIPGFEKTFDNSTSAWINRRNNPKGYIYSDIPFLTAFGILRRNEPIYSPTQITTFLANMTNIATNNPGAGISEFRKHMENIASDAMQRARAFAASAAAPTPFLDPVTECETNISLIKSIQHMGYTVPDISGIKCDVEVPKPVVPLLTTITSTIVPSVSTTTPAITITPAPPPTAAPPGASNLALAAIDLFKRAFEKPIFPPSIDAAPKIVHYISALQLIYPDYLGLHSLLTSVSNDTEYAKYAAQVNDIKSRINAAYVAQGGVQPTTADVDKLLSWPSLPTPIEKYLTDNKICITTAPVTIADNWCALAGDAIVNEHIGYDNAAYQKYMTAKEKAGPRHWDTLKTLQTKPFSTFLGTIYPKLGDAIDKATSIGVDAEPRSVTSVKQLIKDSFDNPTKNVSDRLVTLFRTWFGNVAARNNVTHAYNALKTRGFTSTNAIAVDSRKWIDNMNDFFTMRLPSLFADANLVDKIELSDVMNIAILMFITKVVNPTIGGREPKPIVFGGRARTHKNILPFIVHKVTRRHRQY